MAKSANKFDYNKVNNDYAKLDQKENFKESNVSACLDHNNNQSKFVLYFFHLHNKIIFFFNKVSNLQILIQKLSYQLLDI